MSRVKTIFKTEYKHRKLLSFILVFYLTMGISRYSQVLYFQQNNGLVNYSMAYSAMAVAGALSFLISNNLNNWNLRKIAIVFLPIYALGMFLRIFPSSPFIAVVSGLISGMGASITLIVIRTWIYYESDADEASKKILVSSRYVILQVAALLAIIVAGAIISFFNSSNLVYISLIVLSSICMGSLILFNDIPTSKMHEKKDKPITIFPSNKTSGIILFLVVFFLGVTDALIEPIIPAILRSSGLKVASVTFWTTVFSVLTVVAAIFYQRIKVNVAPLLFFIINQLIIGISMILLVLNGQQNIYFIILAYAIMSFGTAGFFIFKELMEYEIFPRQERIIYLGIAQSGFLTGNALGVPIGTLVFQNFGAANLTVIFGILIIACGICYGSYYMYMKKKVVEG
ncbi:MFS transporter [Lactobacillus sp. YT155]|uniref:MFS transporter n=1 Tax=Lactobacillus sp. YT155 TaxID=3060955 RepID=UPI00265D6E25|nr:MFS transporter [Lactobacillus sp. YT155]MDO1605677.1 MFS transporter [Lactobacillus sp. YT155]